jgi:two-component system OmpR family response regulator
VIQCLLVEDDVEIRELLCSYLQGYGMAVVAVPSAAGMHEALRRQPFDVMLLDLMLPDANGLDLCRQVRGQSNMPVIMLTAQGDPISRVIGLEMGADDYLGKPFEPRELVARINAVLRRTGASRVQAEAGRLPLACFQGWVFDRLKRQLTSPEKVVVQLSSAEFRLLSVLVDHPERVLSREQLLDLSRSPGAVVSDRSIDLTVSRLRHKLRDGGQDGELIRTMRGEGYLFAAKVTA